MREEIIASRSGDSDACCSRLSQWRQVERDGAKTPAMRASPSSTIVSALQLLLQQDNSPLATLMGQHISGVEAGAVSGPADSIHLSARHIGTFPVCSLLHILHLTHQPLLSIYLLGGFFFPLPLAPIKPVRLPRPSTPLWSIRGWFYGLSPILMAI